ncbi:MAG: hypothetical protein IK134_01835 [Oscillospiraceae bacterium]|nr:hypothetical protein [Oscillospiraceae bacterium]
MKYTAQTYSPETESAKTVRLVFASLVMLLLLFAFNDLDSISMLTAVLIWLTIGCAAAAVISMIANLLRRFSQRISRETIMFAICGVAAACIAAASLRRLSAAGCSCELCAGHSSEFLFYLVPPLAAAALIYLAAGIIRCGAERRRKASSEPDETASASENTDIR